MHLALALARVNIPIALFEGYIATETSHLSIDSYYNAVLSCVANCCYLSLIHI